MTILIFDKIIKICYYGKHPETHKYRSLKVNKYIFIGIVVAVVMISAMLDIHWSRPETYRFVIAKNGEVTFMTQEGATMFFTDADDMQACLLDVADIMMKNNSGLISVKQSFHWFSRPTARCEIVAVGDSI